MEVWITSAFLVLAALSSLVLALVVVMRTDRQRLQLRFVVLCFNLSLWALGVLSVVQSNTVAQADAAIRITFVISCFLPATIYQFVCYFPKGRFDGYRWLLRGYYIGGVVLSFATYLPGDGYITEITMPGTPGADEVVLPQVAYGPLFLIYGLFTLVNFISIHVNLIRKLRRAEGIELRQLQHVLLGILLMTFLGSATNIYGPVVGVKTMEAYGPVFIVLMFGAFGYAMVRYQLLDIWVIISRTAVYAVAAAFVIAVFFGSITLVHWGFGVLRLPTVADPEIVSTILAAFVIAWVLHPLNEYIQLILNRTLLKRRYDVGQLLARVSRNAAHHVDLDELLQSVCMDIQATIGARSVRVLLCDVKDPQMLITEYSSEAGEHGTHNTGLAPLVNHLRRHPDAIVTEQWSRTARSGTDQIIVQQLSELNAALCVPMHTSSKLVGTLLLGAKASRDIYTQEDSTAFMSLASPLATAIENARLYRRLEEANLHRERILRNMRGGVIAVDTTGRITTINQGTVELFGPVQLGAHMDVLPQEVARVLRQTLDEARSIRDFEIDIWNPHEESIPVVMSSAPLTSGDGELTGAMVMVYDLSQVKRLEQHVKRADRLSSIGTLAAGMAHEIKNPLVSIKTFSQLLLKRYEDEDFRTSFSDIVPAEVDRIDSIVSRLLDFARPKAPNFAPNNIRAIIEDVFALVENQARSKGITFETSFPGPVVDIYGDEQQLHQVFLNLVLNAIDAMEYSAEKILSVTVEYGRTHLRRKGQSPVLEAECATISLSDTGCGISQESLDRVFTPFYTTKETGTGLGLSVVHGIITEHHGQIDVTSTHNRGTTFSITLPLAIAGATVRGARV